ncbi:unnamed protein product [Amoebophrya sp. A120]|nr:unnamed protein product [Amoebophrya sp. A120]|eukprot:GSA120T00017920001.1
MFGRLVCRAGGQLATQNRASHSSAAATARRCFASEARKHEDLSLAGRYSGALLDASKKKNVLDKVFTDLSHVRSCYEESKDFALFVESPAIQPAKKQEVFQAMSEKYGYDAITMNYLKTLLENRRLADLKRMIDNYEVFYRAEKNQLLCQVTTVKDLQPKDRERVEAMLRKRESGRELIVSYTTNSSILGGIVVKMGESVLDFSVQTKVDRLCAKLAAPA